MNNNKSDEAALLAGCKGVFQKASYISIGTKEKPEAYVKKAQLRDNYKGKQFATVPSKPGRTLDTYLEKKLNWISDGDKYVDRVCYAEAQKDQRKKGFLTGDFRKRDEFSNAVRTEQWREQLKHEARFARKALQMVSGALEDGEAPAAPTNAIDSLQAREGTAKPFLYDLVHEQAEPD